MRTWFARRARTAVSPDRTSMAVVTVNRHEPAMLRRWVAHYGRQVGIDNLFVLDDGGAALPADLPCTMHRLPRWRGDEDPMRAQMQLVNGFAAGLLGCYEVVVLADPDEFLIADPARFRTIVEFGDANEEHKVVAPLALDVVHHTDVEGELAPDSPVLGQRRFAKFVPAMCKPAMKRIPAPWGPSVAGVRSPFRVHRDLFMIRLEFHDLDALRRTAERSDEPVPAQRRAPGPTWPATGDEMASLLRDIVGGGDAGSVPEFDPGSVDIGFVDENQAGGFEVTGRGQLDAMLHEPLVRIPERLYGIV